eukprot:5142920-Pleurochrysis_carterae.AAC.1
MGILGYDGVVYSTRCGYLACTSRPSAFNSAVIEFVPDDCVPTTSRGRLSVMARGGRSQPDCRWM